MEVKEIHICTVDVERPIIHSIVINDTPFIVAIELQRLVLLGASIEGIHSEYRHLNVNKSTLKQLHAKEIKQEGRVFHDAKKKLTTAIKNEMITTHGNEIKRITADSFDYALIYYLMVKYLRYTEYQLVELNNFSQLVKLINVFDDIIGSIPRDKLKVFTSRLLEFEGVNRIGSKIIPLTRSQVDNTNDIDQTIWKIMYINKLIRSISIKDRLHFLVPILDWGLIKCPLKQLFTNTNLINQIKFGSDINFIRSSALRQEKISNNLTATHMHKYDMNNIRELSAQMVEATSNIDYLLDDLAVAMFHIDNGNTLFDSISIMADSASSTKSKVSKFNLIVKDALFEIESFKNIVFQYLWCVLLLAYKGVIHNDPHLHNIIISPATTNNISLMLPSGKVVVLKNIQCDITLIDFDKSILSYRHGDTFGTTVNKINEIMSVVFDKQKQNIVEDYDQIFNCYVMYDVIRFGLIMRRILEDTHAVLANNKTTPPLIDNQLKFIDRLVELSTETLLKIYDSKAEFPFDIKNSYGSIEWLINQMFGDYIKISSTKSSANANISINASSNSDDPELIPSRRRYTDKLKYSFIADYISKE